MRKSRLKTVQTRLLSTEDSDEAQVNAVDLAVLVQLIDVGEHDSQHRDAQRWDLQDRLEGTVPDDRKTDEEQDQEHSDLGEEQRQEKQCNQSTCAI